MIIHRKMGWAYGARKFDIYIDGLLVGKLGTLKTKEFNLALGEHDICCGIDGDIRCEKIFIIEPDNIKLECRISPIVDISLLITWVFIPLINFFNMHYYSFSFIALLQILLGVITLIILMVLSFKKKLIKIVKL